MRWRVAMLDYARRPDWAAAATWLLCFGLIAYLGLDGGGFDPVVHDRVGIAVWWVALVGVLVGALPRRRLGPLAWSALGLLAAFAVWTALSLAWTESTEQTWTELARVVAFLGVFALVLFVRGAGDPGRIVGAVAAAISVVATVALLSRLHPAWFPDAGQTVIFLEDSRERLSYPLNYWNGLAVLIAIGFPLLLQAATCARSILLRGLAAAALPVLVLSTVFTLSRGGIAAAILALAVFLTLSSDRLPKLLTLLLTGAGSAILVNAALQRGELQDGLLNELAARQGDEMLTMTLMVCLVVGLAQGGASLALGKWVRPRWTLVPRRAALAATIATAVVVLVAAAAFDAPGKVSDGWDEFKGGGGPGDGTERLGSVAGQSRYEFWKAAVEQGATKPLTGTGAGTFEFWWARNATTDEDVLDAHSLYLQTLGELGILGITLLGAFLLVILVGGAANAVRAGPGTRPALAAAVAGCSAFCLSVTVDWMWQIPVLPVAFLLLGAVGVSTSAAGDDTAGGSRLRLPARLAFVLAALVAIGAIAVPLASTGLVRQSEAEVREGDLRAALDAARSAQNAQPGAATPRLQQALVLEEMGALRPAAEAARAATEREATNWRTWLVLSRLEAKRGRPAAAVRAYREARSLNPRSPLFE